MSHVPVKVERVHGRYAVGHVASNRSGIGILSRIKQAARERLGEAEIEQMVMSLVGKAQAGDLQAGIMLFGKAAMERGIGGFDEDDAADQATIKAALRRSLQRRLGVEWNPAKVEDDLGAGI